MADAEADKVLPWLCPESDLELQSKLQDLLEERQSGTGRTLFNSVAFQKWLHRSDEKRVLWVTGLRELLTVSIPRNQYVVS